MELEQDAQAAGAIAGLSVVVITGLCKAWSMITGRRRTERLVESKVGTFERAYRQMIEDLSQRLGQAEAALLDCHAKGEVSERRALECEARNVELKQEIDTLGAIVRELRRIVDRRRDDAGIAPATEQRGVP